MINWSCRAIDKRLYEWIKFNLSVGKNILETGSGESINKLKKIYTIKDTQVIKNTKLFMYIVGV